MIGRDLLLKGLGWMIGTRTSVKVWTGPWLSTSEPLLLFGPPSLESSALMVSNLLHPTMVEWNIEAVRRYLPKYEYSILRIIPSSCNMQDELVCIPNTSCLYSRKSGCAIEIFFLPAHVRMMPLIGRNVFGKSIPPLSKNTFSGSHEQSSTGG